MPMVEEAVLQEFERLDERGGVLGAMETMYQRSKIQEESLYYEHRKMTGELPIIGVNTFLADDPDAAGTPSEVELIRSTEAEKQQQIQNQQAWTEYHSEKAAEALERLERCRNWNPKAWKNHPEDPADKKCANVGSANRKREELLNTSATHHSSPQTRRRKRSKKRPVRRHGAAKRLRNHAQRLGHEKGWRSRENVCARYNGFRQLSRVFRNSGNAPQNCRPEIKDFE